MQHKGHSSDNAGLDAEPSAGRQLRRCQQQYRGAEPRSRDSNRAAKGSPEACTKAKDRSNADACRKVSVRFLKQHQEQKPLDGQRKQAQKDAQPQPEEQQCEDLDENEHDIVRRAYGFSALYN
eukprot:Amastigsp_a344124_38.p2 type:complete len:123 gc:universal Amastigsp_a344124_38:544-176(-)